MDLAKSSPSPSAEYYGQITDTPICDTAESGVSHNIGDMSFPLVVSTTAYDIGKNKIMTSFENGSKLSGNLCSPIQFTCNTPQESSLTPDLQRVQILDSTSAKVSQTRDSALVDLVTNEMDIDQPISTPLTPSPTTPVRPEWVGTSHVFYNQNIQLQKNGDLDALIRYRSAITHDINLTPYNPALYIDLARVDLKLGFCDIGVANAHKAIILLEAALHITKDHYPRALPDIVRTFVAKKVQSQSTYVIDDELQNARLKAYRELLYGFLGCGAYWDGIIEAKKALKEFPGDNDLLETQNQLMEGFLDTHNGLKDLAVPPEEIGFLSRLGKIFQKKYPCIPAHLYKRTMETVDKFNNELLRTAPACEVQRVVFGDKKLKILKQNSKMDVGPLGLFARRDIEEGEVVMADQTLTGISQYDSALMTHCDACHGTLAAPFVHSNQIYRPSCCSKVAYCSQTCYSKAMYAGYHILLCGKDLSWLYTNGQKQNGMNVETIRWRPTMFLRLMAIVVADFHAIWAAGGIPPHPLQHHLISRMAANYAPADQLNPETCSDWQYFENVVAPHKALMLLGVNIFSDSFFTPEVIQTIFWSMENNASMSVFDPNLSPSPGSGSRPAQNHITYGKQGVGETSSEGKIRMVCLNQNYLFMNHSCLPNLSWHGSVANTSADISQVIGMNGYIHLPGSSTVFVKAARNIKKGEELKISYVGDPIGGSGDIRELVTGTDGGDGEAENGWDEAKFQREAKRKWLEKWFPGGCGCEICEWENADAKAKAQAEAEAAAVNGSRDGGAEKRRRAMVELKKIL